MASSQRTSVANAGPVIGVRQNIIAVIWITQTALRHKLSRSGYYSAGATRAAGDKAIAHPTDKQHPGSDIVEAPGRATEDEHEQQIDFHVGSGAEIRCHGTDSGQPAISVVQ